MSNSAWMNIYYRLLVEGKELIWCKTCGELFTIRDKTWKRVSKTYPSLEWIDPMANCCEKPVWLFVTDLFPPDKGEPRMPVKSWLQGLKRRYQERFVFEEILE